MRLPFLVALCLLMLVEHSVAFSILPTVTTWRRGTPVFSVVDKPDTSVAPPSSVSADDDVQIEKLLATLEKRMNGGLGSLTAEEVEEFKTESNRILLALKSAHAPDLEDLRTAALQLDARKVSAMLAAGLEMDEETTNEAFWAVVEEVDRAEAEDQPLTGDVPRMLHHIFDADLRHLQRREKQTTNVTCMQPNLTDAEAKARSMNYIFDDSAHKDLPLKEGRKCEGGNCCDACSRNIFPTFADNVETSLETFPDLASLTFNNLSGVASKTILQFMRLIERVRRTIASEYGLPLSTILPLQAYSRKYVAGSTQQGGGGGEGDFVTLHTDEATHSGYHYSCVLYLSTWGEDFSGGAFVFNDPAKKPEASSTNDDEGENEGEVEGSYTYESIADEIRRAGRDLTPFRPTRGAAVIFSSGWENMHEVETITAGTRYCVPAFFTTCPVPDAAYDQMVVGRPKTDEEIADDWLHLLLAHREETPLESTGRVKELLMKWHYMCTPLSEHYK